MPIRPQEPPSVVLDTNVTLDWLLFQDPAGVAIGQQIEAGHALWLATEAMTLEFGRVWPRMPLQPYVQRRERTAAQSSIGQTGATPLTTPFWTLAWTRARLLPPAPAHPTWRCRDTDDQPFLDLAWQQRATLITKDQDLLSLRRRAAAAGLRICTPGQWLDTPATVDQESQQADMRAPVNRA